MVTDIGKDYQTTEGELTSLVTPIRTRDAHTKRRSYPLHIGLSLSPPHAATRHHRRIDVSQDPRYHQSPTVDDSELMVTPARTPNWILSIETPDALFRAGHETTHDLIYARGVPDTPTPDLGTLDRKKCNFIIIEVGFSQDFGCHEKLQEKTNKYAPLVNAM